MKINNNAYQNYFSKINRSVLDPKIRITKAKKIVAVILDYIKVNKIKNRKSLRCLDLGGSAGYTAKEMSHHFGRVYVIDIDKNALNYGIQHNSSPRIKYLYGDALNIPFKDDWFDIVVCNHVYEHVKDSGILINEIKRILKTGGICYFGAANKFWLIEPHHHLPFLSWLPKKIANIYIKTAQGRDQYCENLLSYVGLRRLLKTYDVFDYTTNIIKEPLKYHSTDTIKANSIISKIPTIILKIIEPMMPVYVFIVRKT